MCVRNSCVSVSLTNVSPYGTVHLVAILTKFSQNQSPTFLFLFYFILLIVLNCPKTGLWYLQIYETTSLDALLGYLFYLGFL